VETQIRTELYAQLDGRKVAFNPVEPEPFDLVDLTKDVTNSTRIYHLRTECVREALDGANLIVTDSEPLANAVRRVLPKTPVISLLYGRLPVAPESNATPVVGLLNHSGDVEMNNAYALKLLKSLDRPLLIYGHALPATEGRAEVEENFNTFAAKCDILLLPSLPGALNSTTLPLAMMSAGTAILAHNAPGYYDLDAATGVQLLPASRDPAVWQRMLASLEAQPAKLRTMQERNQAYAKRLNQESYQRLIAISSQLTNRPRRPLSDGCGCDKKKKKTQAPPEPTPPIEPIAESKELTHE
jgi:glycosyltransferase involved in cell wall biosynthesis